MPSDRISREDLYRAMKGCVSSPTRTKILEKVGSGIARRDLYELLREEVSQRVANCVLANLKE